jgi:hypothetical protein
VKSVGAALAVVDALVALVDAGELDDEEAVFDLLEHARKRTTDSASNRRRRDVIRTVSRSGT